MTGFSFQRVSIIAHLGRIYETGKIGLSSTPGEECFYNNHKNKLLSNKKTGRLKKATRW